MLQGSSFDGSWGKKIRCHLFVFLQSSCFLSQDAVCPWSQCIISPFLVEVKNSKSKFYINFHSNVCSLNKKTSEREWKNIEVFEMGFCICIIRNNIYRFRISWNNKPENRLQTETADHNITNVKLIFCFTLLMLGLGLSSRIKYLAFDFIEIVFILLMIEYISVLDNSHRHTIINYDDTRHGWSKA